MEKRVLSGRCDVTGNALPRLIRHQLTARFIPLGNYRGGAGLRCLVILAVLHSIGRPLFRVLVRFERQLAALYGIRERMRGRGRDRGAFNEQGE